MNPIKATTRRALTLVSRTTRAERLLGKPLSHDWWEDFAIACKTAWNVAVAKNQYVNALRVAECVVGVLRPHFPHKQHISPADARKVVHALKEIQLLKADGQYDETHIHGVYNVLHRSICREFERQAHPDSKKVQ